jgi:hypothetical protein
MTYNSDFLTSVMMYSFFWAILRLMYFIYRRLGTLCYRWCPAYTSYEDGADSVPSETSARKIQTPGNHPKERIQLSEHGESLKPRSVIIYNEDKQTHVSNVRLLILFHFISAINFPIGTDRHQYTVGLILTEN